MSLLFSTLIGFVVAGELRHLADVDMELAPKDFVVPNLVH